MNAQKKGLGLGGQTKTLCNTFCARAKQCAMREYKGVLPKLGKNFFMLHQKNEVRGGYYSIVAQVVTYASCFRRLVTQTNNNKKAKKEFTKRNWKKRQMQIE